MTLKNKHRNNGKGKGNRKEQLKRRRKRQKNQVPKTKNSYWCIDGNFTNHPVAYCTYYHGVLTQGLMDTRLELLQIVVLPCIRFTAGI